ncbi:spore wall synthesis complex protein [Acidothermaceae bacterium B102]|nr:spore wall synthesis complex protein [Acidothermaceae bacterium B102]
MPLSDHEQRLLEQIERALYAEDPKFASTVRTTDLRYFHRRRTVRAALCVAVGIGLIVAGVLLKQSGLVVGGGIVVALGLIFGFANWKRLTGGVAATRRRRERTRAGDTHLSLVERFEERWQRRWDQQDF